MILGKNNFKGQYGGSFISEVSIIDIWCTCIHIEGGTSNKDILQFQWGLTIYGSEIRHQPQLVGRIWCKSLKPSCHVGVLYLGFQGGLTPKSATHLPDIYVFFFHFGAAMTVLRFVFRFFCPFPWFNDFKPAALKCIDAYLKMDPRKRIFRSFLWTSLIWGSIFHFFDFVNTSCTSRFNNARTSCCQNGV